LNHIFWNPKKNTDFLVYFQKALDLEIWKKTYSVKYYSELRKVYSLSENFVKVAESKEIGPSTMKAVELEGEKVCIINTEGNYYAIGNVCTHVGGPLDEGTLEGYEVECPWHGSKFDVRNGEPTKPPAVRAVPKYEVKIQGNDILLRKQK
jgi:nitrite reductase/ring-hydroxylating ferredoxin subunit